MKLKKLEIELKGYGPDAGKYVGEATFFGDKGRVTLNLGPDHCERIFSICAEGIVEVAKSAARDLTCAVIEHRAAIDSPASQVTP